MRKVLIYSASTGGGHNQVATVLEEEFQQRGYKTMRHDYLHEAKYWLELLLTNGYNRMATKTSPWFGVIYHSSDHKWIYNRISRFLYYLLSKDIQQTIDKDRPDLIVSTHPLIVNIIGDLKNKGLIGNPLLSVVTDFHAHQSYIHPAVDAYITASEQTGMMLMHKGIEPNKIFSYGIPVKRSFRSRNISKKEGLFTVLLMGGLMGSGAIRKTVRALLDVPQPLRLIVVCSNNWMLKTDLELIYPSSVVGEQEIHICGFVSDISSLMDEADLIVTKPGGITTSEAISKGIPMIIPFLIPGPEQGNAEILERQGVALRAGNTDELIRMVADLIVNPEKLEEMEANMKKLSQTYSMEQTMALAERLIDGYAKAV